MSSFWDFLNNDVTIPIFGAPLGVMAMALGGSIASVAYAPKEDNHLKLIFGVFANAFIGIVAAILLPLGFQWTWVTPAAQPPFAGGVAFAVRFTVPALISAFPEWLKSKLGVNKSSGE